MSESEHKLRNGDDVDNELKRLKEWKETIGLPAIMNAQEYSKKVDDIRAQNEQFKNELIQTQNESRVYQEQIEHLRTEKDDIMQHLTQLKQEINVRNIQKSEEEQLSQETISIKDEMIQSLIFKLDAFEIEKQSLEAHLSSKEEECKAQEMELNEFAQEIQKLKMDKNEFMLQLNEYQENEKNKQIEEQILSQQLQTQDIALMDIKEENSKLKEEINAANVMLRNIKDESQHLQQENLHYKHQLNIISEQQHALRRKTMEYEETIQEYEMVCNELTGKCQIQMRNTMHAEDLAAQYSHKIEEMEESSEISSFKQSPLQQQQTLTHFLLPQKTISRMITSKQSTLSVPSRRDTFISSSRRILSSVIDTTSSLAMLSQNSPIAYSDDEDDNESIITADSFHNEDVLFDDHSNSVSVDAQGTKARRSSHDIDIDIDGMQSHLIPPKVNQSPIGDKMQFDMKLFEKRLKEEINKEMDALQNVLHNEYNVEFEKKKHELITAHNESLFVVTNAHNVLTEKYEVLRANYDDSGESQTVASPNWAVLLSHVCAI